MTEDFMDTPRATTLENKMEQEETPLLAREIAPMFRTTKNEAYRMARENIIPCVRVGVRGRGMRFLPSEVRKALQRRPMWTRVKS
jgi:hypothetical protein